MIIEPVIKGVVARSAHPFGCQAAIRRQIDFVKNAAPVQTTPKRVLIIGASSGFGLASRIALTFGGAQADTIGVSFEKGPSDTGTGTAGWYNNIFFKQEAEKAGRKAINIIGDAYTASVRSQVIEAIETYFEGEVDLVIYSLAAGFRRKPGSDDFWQSTIKPMKKPVTGATILLDTDAWVESHIDPASDQELADTVKVMGGEDWENWIDTLINSDSIAPGCQTLAFSYIGSDITHPIYLDGTLGHAKIDLHQTSHSLNLKLAQYGGGAYAAVCKALVTKASVFIPAFTPYMLALFRVMKEKGTHEGCIEQMQRLFRDRLYCDGVTPVDAERLIRIDEYELDPKVQSRVKALMGEMNAENFRVIGDYDGYKADFLALNGFGFEEVNYDQRVPYDVLTELMP